jgi:hypothetical protein
VTDQGRLIVIGNQINVQELNAQHPNSMSNHFSHHDPKPSCNAKPANISIRACLTRMHAQKPLLQKQTRAAAGPYRIAFSLRARLTSRLAACSFEFLRLRCLPKLQLLNLIWEGNFPSMQGRCL